MTPPLVELTGVSKAFGALRPLRVDRLTVAVRDTVALTGIDEVAAEVFVNLVMGAAVPDTGHVHAFGRATSSIVDSADWLGLADRFGLVSRRAVLLDSLSILQNLALPLTLEIDPLPEGARARASELAREVELDEASWQEAVSSLDAVRRTQVHLARALALDPDLLLLEHPTAMVGSRHGAWLGSLARTIASRRGTAILALTSDDAFAQAVADRVLRLDPSTGRLEGPNGRGSWAKRRT